MPVMMIRSVGLYARRFYTHKGLHYIKKFMGLC
jgi:hypothetical protein